MNRFESHLTASERLLLCSLVGSTWDYYGGSSVVHEGRFSVSSLDIATSSGSITLRTELVPSPMDSGPEDFARLSVHLGTGATPASVTGGRLFFHEKGRSVERVSIVRARVDASSFGEPAFTVSMDHGIVFHLSDRDLYVARGGWFEETLEIVRSNQRIGHLPDIREDDWDSTMEMTFDLHRELLEIRC
ncbi:MAG: hypothetical protein KGR18_05590 [Acidobacteria bacterium]|nr:hypothetical protein [Acidobacteriota bacterium]